LANSDCQQIDDIKSRKPAQLALEKFGRVEVTGTSASDSNEVNSLKLTTLWSLLAIQSINQSEKD